MLNGITYIVRPAMQPSNSPCRMSFISAGVHPVVRRTGVILGLRADERPVLDPRDVARVGTGEEAVGSPLLVQPDERAGLDQLATEALVLLVGSVTPMDVRRLTELHHVGDPALEAVVLHVLRGFHRLIVPQSPTPVHRRGTQPDRERSGIEQPTDRAIPEVIELRLDHLTRGRSRPSGTGIVPAGGRSSLGRGDRDDWTHAAVGGSGGR